ncbi:hypothetical protein [Erysipelothrix larvae]|nr:hypothetical protein [Erysipelothrix larvae]
MKTKMLIESIELKEKQLKELYNKYEELALKLHYPILQLLE